jgi:YbbR domain-containing protein
MAFRDYILDRFWLKLFSFILATLIWFTVQSTSNVQTDFRLATNPFRTKENRVISRPVRLLMLPTNNRRFKIEPVEVRMTIRGSPAALDQLNPSDIQAQVNLTDASDSAASYSVDARNVPRTIQVLQIVPAMVMVEPRAN